jgi:homoserine trans-succinylase
LETVVVLSGSREVILLFNQGKKLPTVVERLALNEESAARLYQGYADAFPTQGEFWSSLAVEETSHASRLRSLGATTVTSSIFIDERRFNTAEIQALANYLDKEYARLNEGKTSLTEALSITLFIEKSLIESKYFEVFKADSTETKRVLIKLHDDTLVHGNKARVELEKIRKNQ